MWFKRCFIGKIDSFGRGRFLIRQSSQDLSTYWRAEPPAGFEYRVSAPREQKIIIIIPQKKEQSEIRRGGSYTFTFPISMVNQTANE